MVRGGGLPSPATAGPPFLTDDPEPVDYGQWEIIGFSMGTLVQGDAAGILPGVEVNYGAMPNVQLHVKVLAAFNSQSATGTQFGYGDTEFGVKYRFINPDENDWWPQVAAYPVVVAPTGNTARDLGSIRRPLVKVLLLLGISVDILRELQAAARLSQFHPPHKIRP